MVGDGKVTENGVSFLFVLIGFLKYNGKSSGNEMSTALGKESQNYAGGAHTRLNQLHRQTGYPATSKYHRQ